MKRFFSITLFSIATTFLLAQQVGSLFKVNAYLQNPAPDGITIMWQTAASCYSWVEYGTDTTKLQVARTIIEGIVAANNTENKIRISGLQANTKYVYRICSREITRFEPYKKEFGRTEKSPFYSFTTFGEKESDFTCLIFNDTHNKLSLFDALMNHVKNVSYDFVLFNGDCFTDLQSKNEAVKILAHYNKEINAANRPAFYMRGNHEVRGAFAMDMPAIFDRAPYFSFTYGDTRFVVLDCGEDKPDTTWVYYNLNDFDNFRQQESEWLKNELNSQAFKTAKAHVLVHHIPMYGNDDLYNPCFDMWNPTLQKAPFNVAINAHTHLFAFHPKGAKGNPFPVVIGGGNDEKSARVMILKKKNGKLSLKIIDTAGNSSDYSL